MSKQFHTRASHKEIIVYKQSLEELIEDNKEYIAWLEKHRGKRAREAFIKHLRKELELVPETGTKMKMPIVEVDIDEATNENTAHRPEGDSK